MELHSEQTHQVVKFLTSYLYNYLLILCIDLRTLTASAEVILSAGVFGTAQILMLSGIGPSAELQRFGITPIVDMPQVGGNLTVGFWLCIQVKVLSKYAQDHPLLPNYFYINGTTFDPILANLTDRAIALAEWNQTKKGRLADANAVALGFLQLPDSSPALKQFGNPSSGPLSANIELLFAVSSCLFWRTNVK